MVPEWKELPTKYQFPEYDGKTVFLLNFNDIDKLAKVRRELNNFDPKLLLFLRRLRSVNIEIDGRSTTYDRLDTTLNDIVSTKISVRPEDSRESILHYSVVTYACPVTVQDEARKNRKTTDVSLAFPAVPEVEACHAYNCLPICPTGFPFLLQGDFILSASREGLNASHEKWNDMILDGLAAAFLCAVDRFNKSPQLAYSWPKWLPRSPFPSPFLKISILIQEMLQSSKVLWSDDGKLCVPAQLFVVPRLWRDNHDTPLVTARLLTPSNLSTKYDIGRPAINQLLWLGCEEPQQEALLQRFKQYLDHDHGATYQSQTTARHAFFATALTKFRQSELVDLPIVPLQDDRWVAAQGLTIIFAETDQSGTTALDIPRGLRQIEIVKRVYSNRPNDPIKDLFTKIGVKQGSVLQICNIIKEAHNADIAPLSDTAILVEHAAYMYKARVVAVPDQLWVADLDGKPVRGSTTYQPEAMLDKDLPQLLTNTTSSRNIMHPDYLHITGNTNVKRFSEWLVAHVGALTYMRVGLISKDSNNNSKAKPTPEFLKLMNTQSPKCVLQILADGWKENFGNSSPHGAIFTGLKLARKSWTGGQPLTLGQTFLPTAAIRKVVPASMPFLQIDNPEDAKWRVLRYVGVTTSVDIQDATFWLSCLRELMRGQPDQNIVMNVYCQLSDLCKVHHTQIR